MGMMKKLKLFPSCTQQPKTASFRAPAPFYYDDPYVVDTPESSCFTNSAELEYSSPLSVSNDEEEEEEESNVEAVVRGAQQAADGRRLRFEGGGETRSVMWAPRSVTVEMESEDPMEDFKKSMEEMVEGLGVSKDDWVGMEELLWWYLKVNDRSNHGYVVAAFVNLVDGFAAHDIHLHDSQIEAKSITCFLSAPSSSLSSSTSISALFLEDSDRVIC